jgi:glyoxylase-like metal-dependent hydrolase (beta-lactamase superfamily II)
MFRISSFFAAIVLVVSLGCPAAAADLTVTTYTASEAGFLVNSHLIAGEKEAILVDAQFTRSEAAKAVTFVRSSGKKLKYIFITHAHPDHFFGLEVLQREFPDARILATADTVADLKVIAPKSIAYWKPIYKDEVPDTFVTPERISATSVFLEGNEIQLLSMPGGESEHATVLWIPSIRAVLTGDLTYNKVHLWLRENRPESWLQILDRLDALLPAQVLTGHGLPGGSDVIAQDRRYLQDYIAATAAPATKEQATAKMKASYSDYALPIIVELAVAARIP